MTEVLVNRRASPRYPLILSAEVIEQASGTRLSARTSDVSRTGCYIDTLNPVPPGTFVRVLLTHDGGTFDSMAKVIYISPGLGMGVQFQGPIPPDQLALLDRWLEAAARAAR